MSKNVARVAGTLSNFNIKSCLIQHVAVSLMCQPSTAFHKLKPLIAFISRMTSVVSDFDGFHNVVLYTNDSFTGSKIDSSNYHSNFRAIIVWIFNGLLFLNSEFTELMSV